MKRILQNTLAIFVGLIIGSAVNMGLVDRWLAHPEPTRH